MAAFKVALLLFLVVLTDRVVMSLSAQQICWAFDDGTFGRWTIDGFQNSVVATPVTTFIPDWQPTAGYAFVQDQSSPSKTGSLTMDKVKIDEYDVISASLYRHVKDYDGSNRINVSWTIAGFTLDLLVNPNYDEWTPIQAVTCSSADKHCCPEYPCTGTLQIFGQVLDQDELVAVDFVGINSNCSGPSPTTEAPTTSVTEKTTTEITVAPPTTKPAPAGYCSCTFDFDVCDWSLESDTEWHWSPYIQPDFSPPIIDGDEYIWIEDSSGNVSSPMIFGADWKTVFEFDYYYVKSDEAVHAYIYFGSNRLTELAESYPDIRIITVQCDTGCCGGASSCDGQFTVSLENVNRERTELLIDRFLVTDSKECPPP